MPRDGREIYKRARLPIGHTAPIDTGHRVNRTGVQTDWEILAQQTAEERRKGKRVNLRYPVEVSGSDRAGKPFRELTYTTDISAKGCRIALDEFVNRGDIIAIRLLLHPKSDAPPSKPQLFRIAWRAFRDRLWMIGAMKLTDDKMWHVEFPDKLPIKNS
jgi:PilZ domain-containing protein